MLPRGHHLLPRQLLALAALGSVWKAVLRELEGRGITGHAGGGGKRPPQGGRSGLQLAPGPQQTQSRGIGGPPARLPPGAREVERSGQGFQKRTRHLLASWKS